jgi:hypothetical protein
MHGTWSSPSAAHFESAHKFGSVSACLPLAMLHKFMMLVKTSKVALFHTVKAPGGRTTPKFEKKLQKNLFACRFGKTIGRAVKK